MEMPAIISCVEAKAQGLKRYFTGKPCKHGHVAERQVVNGTCAECGRLKVKLERIANPERVRARQRANVAANIERVRELSRARRLKNPERERQRDRERYRASLEKRKLAAAAWQKANPERAAAARKAWYERNREARSLYAREWYERNREAVKTKAALREPLDPCHRREVAKIWRAKNAEKMREYGRTKYAKNPDKGREWRNNWAAKNSDRLKEMKARWRNANPLKTKAYNHRRRVLAKQSGGSFTGTDIDRIKREQRCKCAACGVSVKNGYEIDHIKPLSKGGSNLPANIQILCRPCNRRKHARDPIEFMRAEFGRLL